MNNAKNEKRSQSRHIAVVTRQKDKAIFLKIAGILLALIVLSGTALCLLEYFNIINIPLFSSILDSITNADSYDIEKNIPETDTTGFVFYQSPEENISQDAGTGVAFIDNEVLVTLTSENYRSQLEGYLSIIGGRIAGEIPELAEYQIVLEKDYNYAEIQNLVGDAGDENTPWSYYSYKDYKEFLNGDKTNEAMFSRYKNRKKEIQGRLESGNVDAKYDILGAISDESVRDRIIMVGAAQNSGTHNEGGFFGIGGTKVHDGYTVAPFSQCGEIVD